MEKSRGSPENQRSVSKRASSVCNRNVLPFECSPHVCCSASYVGHLSSMSFVPRLGDMTRLRKKPSRGVVECLLRYTGRRDFAGHHESIPNRARCASRAARAACGNHSRQGHRGRRRHPRQKRERLRPDLAAGRDAAVVPVLIIILNPYTSGGGGGGSGGY